MYHFVPAVTEQPRGFEAISRIVHEMEALRGNRGSRPPADISLITGFVKSYLPQVAGILSDADLQDLCNEIDWVNASANSIVFLQNELADCYYLIGKGSINLYFEGDDCVSHALQMSFRPASCSQLGSYLGQLLRGQGFGEYALLANSLSKSEQQQHSKRRHKDNPYPRPTKPPNFKNNNNNKHQNNSSGVPPPAGRSCTAVCGSNDTLLFVVYESTYLRIFKKFHHAQRQLAHTIHFLKKLPIFRHASLAKVTQIAFKTVKTKLPFKAVLGEYGHNIEHVSVVMSGVVRVGARPEATNSSLVLLDDAFILESPSVDSVGTAFVSMQDSASQFNNHSQYTNSQFNSSQYASGKGISVNSSVYSSATNNNSNNSNTSIPPVPSIATLKAGQTIGDLEVHKGLYTHKFHYEVQSLSAEVLQIPFECYLECARDAAFNDTHCANLTVLPDEERRRRAEERHKKLRFVRDCSTGPVVESMAVGKDDGSATERETKAERPYTARAKSLPSDADLHAPSSPPTTPPTFHSSSSTITTVTAPATAPAVTRHTHFAHTSDAPTTSIPPLDLSRTAPLPSSIHKVPPPLATPPASARPSKSSYRTQRATTSHSNASSAQNTSREHITTMSVVSGDGAITNSDGVGSGVGGSTSDSTSGVGAIFSPAPPMGASPRTARTATHTFPYTSTATTTNDNTTNTIDPLETFIPEGRYPEHTSGPNGCASYATSAVEAAQAVAREMRAIRQRVRVKQKSLGFEEIRLDPAGL